MSDFNKILHQQCSIKLQTPKGRWPTIHLDLPSYKISARSRKRSTRYALPKFFSLWPLGANRGPKFTKRGDDLVDSEIYHPAKFHRSVSTHARDIRYQKSCGHRHTHTHKTVNDITPTCLSACGDNKYASYPDWRNPHMPIAVTASGGQFVTWASRLPGQFVAPG